MSPVLRESDRRSGAYGGTPRDPYPVGLNLGIPANRATPRLTCLTSLTCLTCHSRGLGRTYILYLFHFLRLLVVTVQHPEHVWNEDGERAQTSRAPGLNGPAERQHCSCIGRCRRWAIVHDPHVSTRISGILASKRLLNLGRRYPLITLSTRAQVESKRAQSSTYDAVRRIVQREGITGLYSGLESALFGISVTNFVYYYCKAMTLHPPMLANRIFAGYEWTRAGFERAAVKAGRASKKLTTVESMIAGAIAGSATVLITNPIWVVNTRMTARQAPSEKGELPTLEKPPTPKKPSTLATFLSLVRTEGPQALFAGVLPALVLVINPILQYTIFEQLKDLLEKRRKIKPLDVFVLGAIGKLLATSITYPYITIKSRMHVVNNAEGDAEGMARSLKRVVREEGWSGLYKGTFMRPSASGEWPVRN